MTQEKIIKVKNGYFMLFMLLLFVAGAIFSIVKSSEWGFAFLLLTIITIPGFFLVNPNTSKVILLFGKYIGTVKENGFY